VVADYSLHIIKASDIIGKLHNNWLSWFQTMRDELKKLLCAPRIPDEYDLSHAMWIAKNFNSGRLELAMKHQRDAEKEAKTGGNELCDKLRALLYRSTGG